MNLLLCEPSYRESLLIYKMALVYNPDIIDKIGHFSLEEFAFETMTSMVMELLGANIEYKDFVDEDGELDEEMQILVLDTPIIEEYFSLYEELKANNIEEIDELHDQVLNAVFYLSYSFNYCDIYYSPEDKTYKQLEIAYDCLYDIPEFFEGIINYLDAIEKGIKYYTALIRVNLYEKAA